MPPVAEIEADLARARTVRELDPKPQFPYADYVGLMDSLACDLGLLPSGAPGKVVLPQHYAPAPAGGGDRDEAAASASAQVERELDNLREGHGVAAVVFRALHGRWVLRRSIESRLDGAPSGTVEGWADFGAAAGGGRAGEEDYQYTEQGVFRAAASRLEFQVRAEYVFAYNPLTDTLDVFFPPPAAPPPPPAPRAATTPTLGWAAADKSAPTCATCVGAGGASAAAAGRGGLFVSLRLAAGKRGWEGSAVHPCVRDMYDCHYRFAFAGLGLAEVEMTFHVKGQQKDYTSVTRLTRPLP